MKPSTLLIPSSAFQCCNDLIPQIVSEEFYPRNIAYHITKIRTALKQVIEQKLFVLDSFEKPPHKT